jgi:predicted ATPase
MELRPLLGGGAAALGAAVGVRRIVRPRRRRGALRRRPLTRQDILPTLIALVDKSVVLRTEEDAARYWLLDIIREFGAERLARLPADTDATQDQHIAYFRAMAGEFSRHAKDDDQLQRYHLLRREHPDLRAALDRPGRAGEAARLAADLRAYWEISGLLREGKHWLTKILLRFPGPSPERACC